MCWFAQAEECRFHPIANAIVMPTAELRYTSSMMAGDWIDFSYESGSSVSTCVTGIPTINHPFGTLYVSNWFEVFVMYLTRPGSNHSESGSSAYMSFDVLNPVWATCFACFTSDTCHTILYGANMVTICLVNSVVCPALMNMLVFSCVVFFSVSATFCIVAVSMCFKCNTSVAPMFKALSRVSTLHVWSSSCAFCAMGPVHGVVRSTVSSCSKCGMLSFDKRMSISAGNLFL